MLLTKALGDYRQRATAVSFTAAGTTARDRRGHPRCFGVTSGQALAGVVGPLDRGRPRRSWSTSASASQVLPANAAHYPDATSDSTGAPDDHHCSTTPQVVFACVRNGGSFRYISRVLTEHYAGGRVIALSAGTQPGATSTPRSPPSWRARARHLGRQAAKLLTRDTVAASAMAITLGAARSARTCPA